jgi:hypothetical protein
MRTYREPEPHGTTPAHRHAAPNDLALYVLRTSARTPPGG